MIEHDIKATFEGQPLQVLSDLIQKRQKWLNESYKDAVSATAITALKSIRALTQTHFGKEVGQVTSDDATVTRRTDIHPSFSGAQHRRCFRSGGAPSHNAPKVELGSRCARLVPNSDRQWLNAQVFTVKLSKKRLERWPKFPAQFYAVATSLEVVMDYLKKKFSAIAKRQAGLARMVLGAAMAQLSTRPPASEKAGAHVQRIANRHAVVSKTDAGNNYSVHVESNLLYALDAVQGGSEGVQNALKSAANKIAGILKHKAGARLKEDLPTPFPEVKRK